MSRKTVCECWVANLCKALRRVLSTYKCSINGGVYDGDGKEKSRIWLSLQRNFSSRKIETSGLAAVVVPIFNTF